MMCNDARLLLHAYIDDELDAAHKRGDHSAHAGLRHAARLNTPITLSCTSD
jgi:hypothetical protein